VLKAVEESQQRCILLTGWAKLGQVRAAILSVVRSRQSQGRKLSDKILALESVPHDWLFPQCAAVVHHGGAGTIAAGLRARKPTIVVAFFADQFFWGQRIEEQGVGYAFAAASLDADKLRDAIVDVVTNADVKARAESMGALINAEHGVSNAKHTLYSIIRRSIVEQRVVESSTPLNDAATK
jgi:sterol 3beta-glucosyltransferase